MRIGFDASKLTPPRDGIGNATRGLLRALGELAKEPGWEHEVRLYGSLHPLSAEVVRAACPGLPPSFTLAPGRWPKTGEVDVFHATSWTFPAGFRGRVVFSCYDLTFLSHPETHTLENKVLCATGVLQALLGGATFVAISKATASELRRRLDVPAERVRTIYPAADERFRLLPETEANAEARAKVRQRFGVEGDYLLAVGTLEPRKNLRLLLEAYGALDEGVRRRLPLLVAGGQGWGGEDLAGLAASRSELSTVQLLGRVEDDDLPALYRSARAFVYPSLAEGFGLPPLEAMACGTRVVVSSASSLPEVVGEAGRLLDPRDCDAWTHALRELVNAPEPTDAERDRLLAQASRFSWRRAARETFDLYRHLCGDLT